MNQDEEIMGIGIFAYPGDTYAYVHVRFHDLESPTALVIYDDMFQEVMRFDGNIEPDKVYTCRVKNLEPSTEHTVTAIATYNGDNHALNSVTFTTNEAIDETDNNRVPSRFKDFWIAVGQPGAYSNSMQYDEVFGVNERFGIKIKHAPYSTMSKVKNMVVQSWKDEDGDDVWLPRITGSTPGTYLPAITHEAVEFNVKFVIFGHSSVVDSNKAISGLIKAIEGRWLKIWDEYTQIGFDGAYLTDVDDDPKFKRRNYDHVEFVLKFRINGHNIDAPFDDVGAIS